jgi:hypothetical protein
MRLLPNWRAVLRHSWSVKLIAIAGLLSGLEAAFLVAGNFRGWPAGAFAAVSALTAAGAFVARLLAQKSLTRGEP